MAVFLVSFPSTSHIPNIQNETRIFEESGEPEVVSISVNCKEKKWCTSRIQVLHHSSLDHPILDTIRCVVDYTHLTSFRSVKLGRPMPSSLHAMYRRSIPSPPLRQSTNFNNKVANCQLTDGPKFQHDKLILPKGTYLSLVKRDEGPTSRVLQGIRISM